MGVALMIIPMCALKFVFKQFCFVPVEFPYHMAYTIIMYCQSISYCYYVPVVVVMYYLWDNKLLLV